MTSQGGFSEEAIAAIEAEKELLANDTREVVITEDDFSEAEADVIDLKRQVFEAVCKPGLTPIQKEEAFIALLK